MLFFQPGLELICGHVHEFVKLSVKIGSALALISKLGCAIGATD